MKEYALLPRVSLCNIRNYTCRSRNVLNYRPVKLKPILKEVIWGGTRLGELYGKQLRSDRTGESWELALRHNAISPIESEDCATLADYIDKYPSSLGSRVDGGEFPLLIKFIDAHDDLSVQVHPDDGYAEKYDGEHGKSELWYVAEASPDAELVYGFCDGVSKDLLSSSHPEEINSILRRVHVCAGDVYYIPAGQLHAICKGALIAEIQQNSDTTYRIYDYGRLDSCGRSRELHIEKALDVIKPYTEREIEKLRFSGSRGRREPAEDARVICDCEYFRVSEMKSGSSGSAVYNADGTSFASLLFISSGGAAVRWSGGEMSVRSGDSVFVPADLGKIEIAGEFVCLISEV